MSSSLLYLLMSFAAPRNHLSSARIDIARYVLEDCSSCWIRCWSKSIIVELIKGFTLFMIVESN